MEALFEPVAAAAERSLQEAAVFLPPDVKRALFRASEMESNAVAKREYENILKNIALAEKRQLPLCQDTGIPIFYVTIPPDVPLTQMIYDAIAEGVRRATKSVPLRPNVVDPLTRHNTGDNTGGGMPVIHVRPGDRFTITVFPKGAGAENCSRVAMLIPSQVDGIGRFVVETILLAGGKPCPPVVIGLGIGGSFDHATALAKEALLLPVDVMTEYEQKICDSANRLGIGPMGLGGDVTALAVKVRTGSCHTASLPVAVNVQCWANRHATVEVMRQ